MQNYLVLNFLVGAITCYVTGLWTLLANRVRRTNRAWFYLSLCAGSWSLGHYLMAITQDKDLARTYCYCLYVCAICIPSLFLRFILLLVDKYNQNRHILYASYFLVVIFILLLPSKGFINDVIPKLVFNYYDDLGFVGFIFFIFYSATAGYALVVLVRTIFEVDNKIKTLQLSYMAIAALMGFAGGGSSFLLAFNHDKFPYFLLFFPLYPIVVSYAVIKYRFLDIKLIFTRAGVFLCVYSIILGIPIWIGLRLLGNGLWLAPMSLMGLFATGGPFIYFYIQRRAEDRLLQEQRSYQSTLRQASAGMGRIKDLDKLLNMIVYVLTRTVKIEHAVIYVYDDIKNVYKLGAFKHRSSQIAFVENISKDEVLLDYLERNHVSLVFEEIRQRVKDYHDEELISIERTMQGIYAELMVPIYIDNHLAAFVGMGKKESGKLYTEDDLSVFSILANQAALAIENAKFYEDMKVTQQQLFQAEKMATIGIMADGLSHQINNRFHSLGFIAGDALDTIKLTKSEEMSDKLKEVFNELEKAFVRVQDNVVQGGEVVQGLLKYTRKGEEGFSPVNVDSVISSAYEMAQFKIKSYQMDLVRSYDKETIPKVKGNSTQLQEVFFNLIDNAYDAMMQRKNELKEEGYHPKLTISAQAQGSSLLMVFEDNGMGVKEEDVQKLFTPFFTTKLSSKKGTGLGLYVIRKIIEENHQGKVEFVSKHMTGTQMKIRLPIAAA